MGNFTKEDGAFVFIWTTLFLGGVTYGLWIFGAFPTGSSYFDVLSMIFATQPEGGIVILFGLMAGLAIHGKTKKN